MSTEALQNPVLSQSPRPGPIRKIRSFLGKSYLALYHSALMIKAYLYLLVTGKNHPLAHHYIVLNYTRTSGRSGEIFNAVMKLFHPPVELPEPKGYLGNFTDQEIKEKGTTLDKKGFYFSEQRLPEIMVNNIAQHFRENVVYPVPCIENTPKVFKFSERHQFQGRPRYVQPEDLTIALPEVQEMISDPSFFALAQTYLGCQPILDYVCMWWSEPGTEARSEAGQLFHYDSDRTKFVTAFFYLNDVSTTGGPHCYIEGTHKPGAKPQNLLNRGYARIKDEELREIYSHERFQEFCGPKGTFFFENTNGFHKGKCPTENGRLCLQIEYGNSLFGAGFERTTLRPMKGSRLEEMVEKYPYIYQKYNIEKA